MADTGICTAHPGRHELREGCVQWDGSEETRLREELARMSRLVAKGEAAYAGSVIAGEVIGFLEAAGCGKPGTPNTVWAMTQEIIARATAAESALADMRAATDKAHDDAAKYESALAEARGVIRNAPHASDCVTRMWACVSKSCTCWKRGFAEPLPSVEELLAALTSAGEQEAEARTEGETAAKEK